MRGIELVVALLLASTVLAGLARAINVHYAIVLVLGGLVVGLASGTSAPRVEPDIVLFVFLPPLIYAASFGSSTQDLRAHARAIGLLAVRAPYWAAHRTTFADPDGCASRPDEGRRSSHPLVRPRRRPHPRASEASNSLCHACDGLPGLSAAGNARATGYPTWSPVRGPTGAPTRMSSSVFCCTRSSVILKLGE